jgi:hypothetical protein
MYELSENHVLISGIGVGAGAGVGAAGVGGVGGVGGTGVQPSDGIFVTSVPVICTEGPTVPSAHEKITLAVTSTRTMSLYREDTLLPRREQFLSKLVELI